VLIPRDSGIAYIDCFACSKSPLLGNTRVKADYENLLIYESTFDASAWRLMFDWSLLG
jgi:hypothetical protein